MALTDKELRKIAIEGKLLLAAEETLGIYCQKVEGEGGYDKRTEWMEGWNAYGMKLVDNWCLVSDWCRNLPDEYRELVEDLILKGKINLSVNDKVVTLWVNCSDLFWWGCSDGEDINLDELPALIVCLKLSPVHGGDLWCARKRKMRPQKPCYKNYSEEERKLFDECGPERDE